MDIAPKANLWKWKDNTSHYCFYVIHELEILKEDKLPISLSVDMVL